MKDIYVYHKDKMHVGIVRAKQANRHFVQWIDGSEKPVYTDTNRMMWIDKCQWDKAVNHIAATNRDAAIRQVLAHDADEANKIIAKGVDKWRDILLQRHGIYGQ